MRLNSCFLFELVPVLLIFAISFYRLFCSHLLMDRTLRFVFLIVDPDLLLFAYPLARYVYFFSYHVLIIDAALLILFTNVVFLVLVEVTQVLFLYVAKGQKFGGLLKTQLITLMVDAQKLFGFNGLPEVSLQNWSNSMVQNLHLHKKHNLVPFYPYDIMKIYYYINFTKIPYKDFFFHQPYLRLTSAFRNLVFFIHGGRFWFKVRVLRWNTGLAVRFFTWPKRPAIFKKNKK